MSVIFEYGTILISQLVFLYTLLPSGEYSQPDVCSTASLPVFNELRLHHRTFDSNVSTVNGSHSNCANSKRTTKTRPFDRLAILAHILLTFGRHVVTSISLFLLARFSPGLWVVGEQLLQQAEGAWKRNARHGQSRQRVRYAADRSYRLYHEQLRSEDVDWIVIDEAYGWAFDRGVVRESVDYVFTPTWYYLFHSDDEHDDADNEPTQLKHFPTYMF